MEEVVFASTSTSAPERPLPSTQYYSIEYPGYITSHAAIPQAITKLGGQKSIDAAFRSRRDASILELHLRGTKESNPFQHPIPGDIVPTNHIILKVVKRRYKVRSEDGVDGDFVIEPVAVSHKTARFRSQYPPLYINVRNSDSHAGMADFQYQPDMEDPISKLRVSMAQLDGERLLDDLLSCENIISSRKPMLYVNIGSPRRKKTTWFL